MDIIESKINLSVFRHCHAAGYLAKDIHVFECAACMYLKCTNKEFSITNTNRCECISFAGYLAILQCLLVFILRFDVFLDVIASDYKQSI